MVRCSIREFEGAVELAQLLLGFLLRRMPSRQSVGHFVEGNSEATNFRRAVLETGTGSIIPVAPFGGDAQQVLDRPADKVSTAYPRGVNRRKKAR